MNLEIVLNTFKNPFLNEAAQKILSKIFLPKKILKPKISNPKTSFDRPCHLKSGGALRGYNEHANQIPNQQGVKQWFFSLDKSKGMQ